MAKKTSALDKINFNTIIHVLIITLAVLFIINLAFTLVVSSQIKEKIKILKEDQRPANIELTILESNCADCFNIDQVVNQIKSLNVKVENEKILNQNEASELIKKYNIKKLPTVMVTGEINKTQMQFMVQKNNILLFDDLKAPYYDLNSNKVVGKVKAQIINIKNCKKCFDVSLLLAQANELINKFKLDKLPALILSEDLSYYPEIVEIWKQFGKIEQNQYVLTKIIPPYKNLQNNKIEGLVKATYISDKSCIECFNINNYNLALKNVGIIVSEEEKLDISSQKGKELIQKYNIKKLPVMILSNDVKVYSVYSSLLKKLGTENTDGTYLFTAVENMGTYKDLSTNQIIKQKAQ